MDIKTVKLNITGMTCGGCTAIIQKALLTLNGIDEVTVNHKEGTALINFSGEPPTTDKLVDTVRQVGYETSVFSD